MRKLKVLILLILVSITSNAQRKYKAYYDYQTDQMLYFELDNTNKVIDTLNSAAVKRGSTLIIEVDNVNPFALSTETTVSEETLHQSSSGGFNFSALLGNIQNISGGGISSNVPDLPSGELESFGINSSRGGGSMVDNLEKLTVNLRSLKTSLLSYMRNPNLTKNQIIDKVKYLASLFDDPRLPDPEDNLYFFLETLEGLIKSDSEKLKAAINSNADGNSRGAENTTKTLRSFTEYNAEEVNDVTDMYSSVEAASFKQIYDYSVSADRTLVKLEFTPTDDGVNRNDNTPIKTRTIPIKARGGFKVNSGIALTINNFKNNSKDFFIDEDGIIGASSEDNFVPNLSTMINFYPVIGKSFNMGGSFGVSIPITGDLRGVNFLIGPSLFFGDKNRFSFSGGLAFGPVRELTNGLEIGDAAISTDLDNFTKNVYDTGFYFGVSFSLFDLN